MARIRSIHPGLFTDPEFVQVSMAARLLLIGLWGESDDHGVFEWKPLALKMKIFPGDTVDMDALMSELTGAGRVRNVTEQGKSYGICRNFCRYQKPKSPSYRMPFSPAWEEFVGIKSANSDSPTPALPQDGGKVPAAGAGAGAGAEDGEEQEQQRAATPISPNDFHPRYTEVRERVETLLASPNLLVFGRINVWLQQGADPETEIYPILESRKTNWRGKKLEYFDDAIADAVASRNKPMSAGNGSAGKSNGPRIVPRHEARDVLEAAGLFKEPDLTTPAGKAAYPDWKQKREAHLRSQGIDPRSLTQ